MLTPKLAFVVHAVVETAAAISFIFHPERQLPGCTPAAKLILRQYGGLLLSSNFVCLAVIAESEFSHTARLLAVALGSYHAWPCHRAYSRMKSKSSQGTAAAAEKKDAVVLGGPFVHLVVHVGCLALFVFAAAAPLS
ncbi:hypothetical protein F4778DRAFT_778026 [Xylariomycetidae sp. FL2044]|nr:hypothetical protein F4778DRAFT_778026 [Xylariomycetidae sp. FL2044]